MTLVQKFQDPVWSDLSIVKSLSEFDFNQGGGRLILECVSQVAGYESNAVLELASARHPVPERGEYPPLHTPSSVVDVSAPKQSDSNITANYPTIRFVTDVFKLP